MNNFVLNKYLVSEFFKSFFNVVLVFCCLGLILNLFEEINYFKNYDVGIGLPIVLSLMIIPSIVINMLPFILFLSSMWTFIKLKNNRDILSLKTFGLSNVNFLILFCLSGIFIGIVTLFALTPMTSVTVKYYEDIKGKYDIDKSHLASINTNGIWVREKSKDNINIIESGLFFRMDPSSVFKKNVCTIQFQYTSLVLLNPQNAQNTELGCKTPTQKY